MLSFRMAKMHQSIERLAKRWQLKLGIIFLVGLVLSLIAYVTYFGKFSHQPIIKTPNTIGSYHYPQYPPESAKSAIEATVYGHAFGIAAGSSLSHLSDRELSTELDAIAATGAGWIRFDIDWSIVQADSISKYDWSGSDRLTAASAQRHLRVLAILDYTPAWARSSACKDTPKCQPANSADFANFAKAAAKRYNSSVHAWEIWNEPNNPMFWAPKSEPRAYAALLADAYAAIHSVDISATVITAGLSPQSTSDNSRSPIDFLKALYASGAKPYFDAVADHPYTFPLTPTSSGDHAWRQMAAATNSLRQTMLDNNDGSKKLWITEFGAPTGGPGPVATLSSDNLDQHPYVVDEALQAKALTDAIILYKSYPWAGPFMYYSFQDAGTSADTNENFFGLVRSNGSHKAAYSVFKAAAMAQN